MKRHRESPMRRVLPSGKIVWLARYTDPNGKRQYAKPDWNGGRSTFVKKGDAQKAIDEAYALPTLTGDTVGGYGETWTDRHPRSERTNTSYNHRLGRCLDIEIEGRKLRDWPIAELRRKHALAVVDHLFREQGRAPVGVVGIIRILSAMTEDAITDEVAEVNVWKGIKVRANDPRAQKARRPIRVFTFAQMHAFANAAGTAPVDPDKDDGERLAEWKLTYAETLVRVFSDCGLRLGEVLPLERRDFDGKVLMVRRTAHEGKVIDGTKTTHGDLDADEPGRTVPVPPTLAAMIRALPARIDTPLLFPSATGKVLRESNLYRDLWRPTQRAAKLDVRPHEMRHSWVSHLLAASVNEADVAEIAGHTVLTMKGRYQHAVGQSEDQVRKVVG